MKSRKTVIAAVCLIAAFMLTSSFMPEVTITKTTKRNKTFNGGLTVGIQAVLDVAEENGFHEEIGEVLNEGIVQNNHPGYDWNIMALANVEDTVNMRANPDEEAEIVGKLPKGGAGTILEGTEGWTKLSSGSVEGWVSDEYLLFDTDAEERAEELGSYKATINTDALRIRAEASEDAKVLDLAEKDSTYEVVTQMDGWVEIQLSSTTGFVSAEYVTTAFQLEEAMSIEEIRAAEEKAKKAAEEKKRKEAEEKAKNSSDVALLAAIVQMEAGGESFEGKLAVASVVMNRVRSSSYPNTVHDVIYAAGQFPPAHTARMASLVANGASAQCVQAAQQAIGGVDNVGGRTHFHAARLGGTLVIGNHAFY